MSDERDQRKRLLWALPLALLLGACEGLSSSPEPVVSVLVRTSDRCFALMTTAQPVAAALGIGGQCQYDSPPQLLAGIDLVEAVIDYGPDVQFAPDTIAPSPTVTVTVDGAPSTQPVTLSPEQRVGSRAFFIATFRAPPTPSNDVQITAGVNSGFETTVPMTFESLAPDVEMTILECAIGVACDLTGGVGQMHVQLSVPGDVPQTITVHESIAGVLQQDPIAPVVTSPNGAVTSAVAVIPIPPAPAGSQLELSTQLDAGQVSMASVTILAPDIQASLTCGSACTAGDTVGLTITAPGGIVATQAIIDATLDGVPQIVEQAVQLQPLGDTATGLASLQVPAQKGTWMITVSVIGYVYGLVATVQ